MNRGLKYIFATLLTLAGSFYFAHAHAAECATTPEGLRLMPPVRTCCVTKDVSGQVQDVLSNCEPGYAAVLNDTGTDCKCEDAKTEFSGFIKIVNGVAIPVSIILGLFIIALSGYKIMTSQGNPQELQSGKENLTSAIIGLIFVLMAVSILRVIIKALITGNADPFS